MKSSNEVSVSGAEPHGRVEEVVPPIKLILALPASNQEPTLSDGITHSPSGELDGFYYWGSPLANCVTTLPLVASLPPSIKHFGI